MEVYNMFLSLNIHEALTFETEICLHPDIFSNNTAASASDGATIASGRHSVSNSNNNNFNSSNNNNNKESNYSMSIGAIEQSTSAIQRPLQPGDFVEIRVWDGPTSAKHTSIASHHGFHNNATVTVPPGTSSVTTTPTATSAVAQSSSAVPISAVSGTATIAAPGAGTTLRRRGSPTPPPPPIIPPNPTDATSDSIFSKEQEENLEVLSVASSSDHRVTPQQSPHPAEEARGTVNAAGAAALPPPFPRGRTVTTDSLKPPLQRRPVRNSPKLAQPRHVREISDISADPSLWGDWKPNQPTPTAAVATAATTTTTISTTATSINTTLAATTTLDASHRLVDLQVPFSSLDDDTHEEEDSIIHHSHTLRVQFYMLLNEASLTSLKVSARTQVSLLRQVADLYNLSSYDMVTVHRVTDPERVRQQMAAEFVLVTMKDQYLSRGDLHFFQQSFLQGSFLYEGQRLHDTVRGIQAHAREIRVRNQVTPTGIVTEHTKIAYRSRSSRIFWLLQMSAELWEYSAPFANGAGGTSEVYFDKFLAFVYELFEKWKSVEVTHSLTVAFFSRTFLNAPPGDDQADPGIQKDSFGRFYEDHCRLVVENETRTDWNSLILQIRQAFWRYPEEVGWNLSTGESGRWPSTARQGNILEAINVTLNLLQYHYLDRDLHRTGNSIVVVSAGTGVFEVSKELAQITYQRMMDNGIGSDMLSLGLPPLHTAPFFMYVKEHQAVETEGVDSSESYFEVPHWMHLSFVSYEGDSQLPTEKKTKDSQTEAGSATLGRLEVGANGFILRPWTEGSTLVVTPSDAQLSPQATIMPGTTPSISSPTKSRVEIRKERQLIEGRDFEDILRASRPKHSAVLPPALRALLQTLSRDELHTPTMKGRDETEIKLSSGNKGSHIREWNSMESDDASEGSFHRRGRAISLGHDPRDGTSPMLMSRSPPRMDPESVDRQSNASSSLHSAGVLGSSYETRVDMVARHLSPKLMSMELQRTRSLEFGTEGNDESEKIESDETSTFSMSRLALDEDRRKFLDNINALMKSCDMSGLKVNSPKIPVHQSNDRRLHSTDAAAGRPFRGGNLSKSPLFGPRNLSSLSTSAQVPGAVGGIGAALSQYRGSGNSLAADADTITGNMSRVSSYSRLPNSHLLRIPEMISSGMSPLLLPPTQGGSGFDMAEPMRSDHRFTGMERRLVETQRYGSADAGFIRPLRGRQSESSMNLGSDRRMPSLPSSPPKPMLGSSVNVAHLSQQSKRSLSKTSKKKKAFNPFRQQDEDAVLAEKSHNRRRWSHVFPATEVEFKRHAGPNWKSLSAPAILPISVDYFPPQAKIDLDFRINQYSINVSDFEHRNFSSTKFLLMEMVRQRITQDYQLVPRSNVNASNYRKEWLSRQAVFNEKPSAVEDQGEDLRMFLSMGHRLQVLSYVASADTVHVTQYKTSAVESIYRYHYNSYSQETGTFVKNVQSFQKYASPYNWNKVDRILSGDTDRELREGMRVKRLIFLIIPDKFSGSDNEEKYIAKFKRLLEYFEKLRPKEELDTPLRVRVIASSDQNSNESEDPFDSTPGIEGKSMVRIYVPLKKGRRDQFEYIELSIDATFNTSWSYRIIISWLAASTTKIDAQVQSLQRRCSQYGLTLIPAAQVSVSRSVFLNPFRAPTIFSIRDRSKVPLLYAKLAERDFLHDGVFSTEAKSIAECIEGGNDYKFRRYGKLPNGRQFLHRSGTLFVRIVVDKQGWGLAVSFCNSRFVSREPSLHQKCCDVLRELGEIIESLD